ncbi:hypothetical protein MAR_021282, partial [Mya arenaria]
YQVRPTGPPHLSANEVLLAGETVDITCTSSSARPQPLLRFLVDDTKIDTKTNVSTTFDDLTGLYKSVSKLHTFKKKWGNKNMSCQQLPEVNGLYHETVSNNVNIVYKFPPSRLILVVGHGTLSKYERKDERETRQSGKGSFLWIVVSVIAVVTLGSFVLIVCCCRKRLKRVYENLYTHQVRNMYQGSALPSLYRHTELDEKTSPGIYDEVDENNLSIVQAETNLTTDDKCQSVNSSTYDIISETISTGTHTTESTHDYSEINNLGSLRLKTDSEGGEGYLHVVYELH